MQRELQRILELQPSWTSRRSPEMDERGKLVRDGVAQRLDKQRSSLAQAAGIPGEELLVKGGDGTGLKTRVPWIRFGSRERSPRTTDGFYVVYLPTINGSAMYLS